MLENKKVNMIISLVIAISLWAFVIGEVNPEATRVYREIPVRLVNEQVLEENGLAVFSVSDTIMSITVTGNRSDVNQINTKDIVARVDLERAVPGTNQLPISVRVPSKVDIDSQSIEKVTVVVEYKVEKDVPIQVVYNGSFEEEAEPVTIEQSLDTVTVSGAESSVGRVAYVEAVVEEGSVAEDPQTFTCNLIPMDGNGMQVNRVELSHNSVDITAELVKKITVPLHVPILNDEDENMERKVTVPETITLKGRNSDLESIEKIEAETVDIRNVMENATLEIKPILPEGVEVSIDSKALFVTVQVTNVQSRTFTVSKDQIVIQGLEDNHTATIKTTTIQVHVSGNADTVNSLTEDQIDLYVDIKNLNPGQHTVDVMVTSLENGISLTATPKTVKVVIEEVQTEEENEDVENDEKEEDIDTKEENSEE
ncbi:MAG: hypothetical protein IKU44_01250 [Firmicutes bacterium]|nr:hypothetical protein [Bacillota bacterium]